MALGSLLNTNASTTVESPRSQINCTEVMHAYSRMSDNERAGELTRLIEAVKRRKDERTNFFDHFKVGQTLGQGSFGTVYLSVDKETQVPCATKIIDRQAIKDNVKSEKLTLLLKNELRVMLHLQNLTRTGQAHDNLTKVIAIYKDPFQYYLVMELVPGGNLLDFYNDY